MIWMSSTGARKVSETRMPMRLTSLTVSSSWASALSHARSKEHMITTNAVVNELSVTLACEKRAWLMYEYTKNQFEKR